MSPPSIHIVCVASSLFLPVSLSLPFIAAPKPRCQFDFSPCTFPAQVLWSLSCSPSFIISGRLRFPHSLPFLYSSFHALLLQHSGFCLSLPAASPLLLPTLKSVIHISLYLLRIFKCSVSRLDADVVRLCSRSVIKITKLEALG